MRVLFICARNRRRSPTAEAVIGALPGVETDSAGVQPDADVVVSLDQIEWAELIVVMENRHRRALQSRFGSHLRARRIVSLAIPDDYDFMDPALVDLIVKRVSPLLR